MNLSHQKTSIKIVPMLRKHLPINRHILWICYLIVTLIFVQGAQLHLHLYDHHHDYNQHNVVNIDIGDHQHLDQVHSAHHISDAEHSLDFVTTVDIDIESFQKKLSSVVLSIIVFLLVSIILVLPRQCVRTLWRRYRNTPLLNLRCAITPPLRAPPL